MVLGRDEGGLAMSRIKFGKGHKALLVVAGDKARPILDNVHVVNGYAEAVDGFILLRIPVEVDDDTESLIPSRLLALGMSGLRKNERRSINVEDNGLSVEADGVMFSTPLASGEFPRTAKLMVPRRLHDAREVIVIGFSLPVLQKVVNIAKAVGLSGLKECIRFQISGPISPVRVDFGELAEATIMPMTAIR